jgi:glycosyltransferase involved in cell wall biosynthesis
VNPRAYEAVNSSQLASIPEAVVVKRVPTLDAARHFSLFGRYPARLAMPDRWRSWRLLAVPMGLQLIRKYSIDAIWSTYPIATAHSIGAALARRTGLPWIADFRDPMVEHVARLGQDFPRDPALRAARLRVEAQAVQHASRLVFCTDAARRIVAERYPSAPSEKLAVISNGYDEAFFTEAEKLSASLGSTRKESGKRVLLHSGVIYFGADRDPEPLFRALKRLAERGVISATNFELRLRSPSNEQKLKELTASLGIVDLVAVMPAIPYVEALAEMMSVDGLLVLQGFTSNPAVPAKLYEYLRAGRPIVALVDEQGETAATLRAAHVTTMADIADAAAIGDVLEDWLAGTGASSADRDYVERYSRARLTGQLARLLDTVAAERRP